MLKTWNDSGIHTYFATTPPGLEALAHADLVATGFEVSQVKLAHGGVEFAATNEVMPALIRSLKIPTHLLWRLGSFRVRDFPKLYSKAKSMTWAHFLVSDEVRMKVSATNSRLIHSGRIEKTLREAIRTSLAAHGPKKELIKRFLELGKENHPTLYARIDNDTLTLSLDLAGENLHRRSGGAHKHVGAAPLRENLAHACLMLASDELLERGHHPRELTLWDPFCGSGTLLMESLAWKAPNERRSYALDLYESYIPLQSQASESLFKFHLGTDLDSKIITAAAHNLGQWGAASFSLRQFDVRVAEAPSEKFVIITNPPYGERIKSTEGLGALYERVRDFSNCLGTYVLIPHHLAPKMSEQLIKFSHGGISVGLYKL